MTDGLVGSAVTVDIGGIPVLLSAEDGPRSQAIADLLPGLAQHPGPARLAVHYLCNPPPLPPRAPDQEFADMRVWRMGGFLVLQDASDVRARVSTNEGWIGGHADDLGRAYQQLFLPTITHLLGHQDRFVLHGAGIVRDSGAYVVLGRTGAGKSSLGLAAIRARWRLLGDDMVVIRPDAHTLEVAGIGRRPAVPSDLGRPPAGSRRLDDDPRGRWELSPLTLTSGWFPLRGMILVGHGSTADGSLAVCSGGEVFRATLGSFFSGSDPLLLRRFFPYAAAVSRLSGWALGLGCQPESRLAAAGRLLAAVDPPGRGSLE